MSIEAMKQALEALELLDGAMTVDDVIVYTTKEIAALRQAIKEAKTQPVAKNESGRITWLVDNWPKDCLLYSTFPVSSSGDKRWIDDPQKVATQAQQTDYTPVAWSDSEDYGHIRWREDKALPDGTPLYLSPQPKKWISMTNLDMPASRDGDHAFWAGAQFADAWLKEKNT